MQLFQNLIVSLLPRDDSFTPSRAERLYVVIFKSTFEILLKSKTDPSVPLTLRYSQIIQAICLLLSQRFSSLCAASS